MSIQNPVLDHIRTFYTAEYHSYLYSYLPPHLQNQSSFQDLPALEACYKRATSLSGSLQTGLKLERAANSCELFHCLIALNMEPKPSKASLDQALYNTCVSAFDDPTPIR